MRSGVRKRVLIPAMLIAVVCTLVLGAYCMYLQARLAVQIQEEDIRECMEAQPFPELDVPLVAEASYGPDFGHMKEME